MLFRVAKLSQLAEFDAIIDVRTPAEYAEDHIPGAINCPVFSNEERVIVGTLYKQESPFAARKVGAAMAAKNIAHHLQTQFCDHPKSWQPLVYCWRGGQRSGAMSIILAQVGWAAHKLEGGYKNYRSAVLTTLETLPQQLDYRVLCGATGCGKSRLLAALSARGAQVLDLENLAQHRGSILGALPQQAQPSQRNFETQLVQILQNFDPAHPVFVEAESNKIGRLNLPHALHHAMHHAACVVLDTRRETRIQYLLQDYRHLINAPEKLICLLQALRPFHARHLIDEWEALIHAGAFSALVNALLEHHYDPSYQRALNKNYRQLDHAQTLLLQDLDDATLLPVAQALHERG